MRGWARLSSELGRELRAVVRQGRLIAAAPAPEEGLGRVHGEGDRLVVFVHGFMARGPVFDPMRRHVESKARVATVDLSYGPLERFETVAARAHRAVREHGRGRPVTLVGHSLGGLVSRWLVQEMDGHREVDRVITLATPHEGTRAARLPAGPLVEAIRPASSVVRQLEKSAARLEAVHTIAAVAGRDRMVTPPDSAARMPGAEVVWFDDLGHNEILFDPRVIELVATRARG